MMLFKLYTNNIFEIGYFSWTVMVILFFFKSKNLPVYSGKHIVREDFLIFSSNRSFLLRKRMMEVSVNHLLLQIESNNFKLSCIRFWNGINKQYIKILLYSITLLVYCFLKKENFRKEENEIQIEFLKIPNKEKHNQSSQNYGFSIKYYF